MSIRRLHLVCSGRTLSTVLGKGTSGTSDLLTLVLGLLDSLTRLLLHLEHSVTCKTMLGLELQASFLVIVDKAESGGLSSSELCLKSKKHDKLGVGLVHLSNNLGKLSLRNIGASRMNDVDNHLWEESKR